MDKRTMLALGLTLAILFIFQAYFLPKAPQQTPVQTPSKTEAPSKEVAAPAKDGKAQTSVSTKESAPPAQATKKATKRFVAETPFIKVTLDDLGGGISSVQLKKYKANVKETNYKEVVENIKPYTYIPRISQTISTATSSDEAVYFSADKEYLNVTNDQASITLTGKMADGTSVSKKYTFSPDGYTIGFTAAAQRTGEAGLSADFAVISDKKESAYVFKGPFLYNNKLKQIDKIDETLDFGKNYTYAGFDEGFFAFIWIPESDSKPALSVFKTGTNIPVLRCSAGSASLSGKMYFGPKDSNVLKGLNIKAEKIIDFGWFDIIAKPLILALKILNKFTHNYGIDIILLTILIKLIFHPLSVKSYRSMKKMQDLQPLIKQLREKYPNDKQKLNQEMMQIYKTRGINPMGGCLPMIIQIPVFFALYKGLSGAIELRHAPFMFWINDLSAPEDLFSFTVLGYTLPIRILPLIMGVTQVIQQKMTPTSMDPLQEKMMLFMPIFFTFLFWGFPSGLVLYWLVNNVISIGQQYYINKQVK
ncbi:MAG TPA: membrane protein insertase YidC [Syntrophorhabdaceae bacterium]|nr:membrane protein insertase YidC [Syntrophorhabdaceae bacterium]